MRISGIQVIASDHAAAVTTYTELFGAKVCGEGKSGVLAAQWDGAALAALPVTAIVNAYHYAWASRFRTERIGFSGQTGARATITLPAPAGAQLEPGSAYQLELEAIDGTRWTSPLR